MATKTLRNFQVAGALFVSPGGAEIAAGDEVRLFLNQVSNPDFPEYIDGIAQNPITRVNIVSGGCVVEGTSYTFEYESDDLDGAATQLNVCDVTDVSAIACCEVLREALDEEIAARTAADAALQVNIDEVQDDLDTWDVITLSAEPVQGVAGVPQVTTQTMVGTIATSGTLVATITGVGITGSPLAVTFDVDAGDVASVSAAKAAAKLATVAAITALYTPSNIGADFALTEIVPNGNDGTLNIAITNGTATGLTPDASSTATVAGIAEVAGTEAARVGQHARWGDRIWEAVTADPAEWLEITTATNSVMHRAALTGFTGGGAANLDGLVVTTTSDIGRFEILENSGLAYGMELVAGTNAESAPDVVRPDNYGATNPDGTTNNLVWKFRPAATLSVAILDASTGGNDTADEEKVPKYNALGGLTVSLGLGISKSGQVYSGNFLVANITASRDLEFPNAAGTIGLETVIVAATPLTGFTITATTYVNQTHYLTPAGVLATGAFTLPTAANSRAGQIVRFVSTQVVTNMTVTVSGGGSILGTAITAAAITADTPYSYQCVSTAGAGVWLRLQ